jgi:pimeloyl-ACP methyl ester carboxylesterase
MVIVLITSLILIILAAAAMWKMGVKSQTPRRISNKEIPPMFYEDITFTSHSAKVKGWFIPSKNNESNDSDSINSAHPLIILVHGWGASRASMLRYALPLYAEGYALLLFDVRSHGESDGVPALTVKTFRDDVISAIQYAKKRHDVDPTNIGIVSHSFGGFGSVLTLKNDMNLRALVTDSMPVQFRTIMEAGLSRYKLPYFPFGYILLKVGFLRAKISKEETQEFDVVSALDQRKTPVFLVHSLLDDYVPSSELDFVVQNVSKEVEYLHVNNKGHRSSETDPLFWQHVLPFLKQHLILNNHVHTDTYSHLHKDTYSHVLVKEK